MRDELDVELVFKFVGPGDQSADLVDFLYSENPTSGLGYPDWVRSQVQNCPRCGKEYSDFPALSRVDNKTNICSTCGTEEAIQDYVGEPLSTLNKFPKLTMPVSTVINILENINTYLVVHEDQEAWQYTQVVLKGIKDGEIV